MTKDEKHAEESKKTQQIKPAPDDSPDQTEVDSTDYRKLAEEYLNNWKRTQADFENYKKDQARVMEEFARTANLSLILQILPILDNFNASLEHVPNDQKENAWVTGINHIKRQLEDVLKSNGLEEIEVKEGDKFDPALHEAIMHELNEKKDKDEKKDEYHIRTVVQKGYKFHGKVLRAARVTVD